MDNLMQQGANFQGKEEESYRRRQQIVERLSKRGLDSYFVRELSEESVDQLERRLNILESKEKVMTRLSQNNWISSLLSMPNKRKARQLPLQYDDLPKDPLRVMKLKIERLEKQYIDFTLKLAQINKQIEVVMGYDDSDDRIAKLEEFKAPIETALLDVQEKLVRFAKVKSGPL